MKCRCSKCRLSNEEDGFKLVTYRTQQRHHKEDVERQRDTQHMPNIENENEFPEQYPKSEDLQQSPILELVHTIEDRGPHLQKKIKKLIIKMQVEWDSKGMSVYLQDWTLRQIFEGLPCINDESSTNFNEDRLAYLIKKMPLEWDGSLEGHNSTPPPFKLPVRLYKRWSLVQPKR